MKKLGTHERTVLEALRRAPDMLAEYYRARPGLRARDRGRILSESDRSRLDAGCLVPTGYLRWYLPDVHRSTFSRTLRRLEDKGILYRANDEADDRARSGLGSYTKFVAAGALTNEPAGMLAP
jgi:hypothetical protein